MCAPNHNNQPIHWLPIVALITASALSVQAQQPASLAGLPVNILYRADSLFKLKQYTESMDLYSTLYNNKFYSPSMLLKMAFIEEGLHHTGPAMLYLNLYSRMTHDPLAEIKIHDMAQNNHLEGYADGDVSRFGTAIVEYRTYIIAALASIGVLLWAFMFYQRFRLKENPVAPGVLLVAVLALTVVTLLYHPKTLAIIANPSTYVMAGPSSGANVLAIVGEGHRLQVRGKKDVWLKVEWLEQDGYIRQDQVLTIH